MALNRYHFRTSKIFRDRSPKSSMIQKYVLSLIFHLTVIAETFVQGTCSPGCGWTLRAPGLKDSHSLKFLYSPGEPRKWWRTTLVAQVVSSPQFPDSRWLSAQQLRAFRAQRQHRVPAWSEESSARQKCLHQEQTSAHSTRECHLCETLQSFTPNQLLKQEKFMAAFLGCQIWQTYSSFSENRNTFSEFDDKA